MLLQKLCIVILSFSLSSAWAQSQTDDNWDCEKIHCQKQKEKTVFSKIDISSHASSRKMIDALMARNLKLALFGGGAWILHGQNQTINIDSAASDYFSVNHTNSNTGIVGAGFYLDNLELRNKRFTVQYTATAFYLPVTRIFGSGTLGETASNFTYDFSVGYLPTLFGLKFTDKPVEKPYHVTIDLGLGFDTLFVSGFHGTNVVPPTVPDYFAKNTDYSLAATAGVGFKVYPSAYSIPIEIGYRFFYLGQGHLPAIYPALGPLGTGYNYANVVMLTLELG